MVGLRRLPFGLLAPWVCGEPLPEPPEQTSAIKAAESCVERGHRASGPSFTRCVEQLVPEGSPGRQDHRRYAEELRNFSCATDDDGSQAVRSTAVIVDTGYDDCLLETPDPVLAADAAEMQVHPDFIFLPGMLPAGNDLMPGSVRTTAESAAEACGRIPGCGGFTMSIRDARGEGECWFKSTTKGFAEAAGWQSFQKLRPATCTARPAGDRTVEEEFAVDVLREEPLLAIVRGIATDEECDALLQAGGDLANYSRAYTSHGTHSFYRRSYGANIHAPLGDPTSLVTHITLKMFAATRNLTGYAVYPAGQEPINGVLYRSEGDEYRTHCDGGCNHETYQKGERIATSFLYCIVPEKGGATSFTTDSMKIVPQSRGDMLLFAYWPGRGERMAGEEAEHSGCPLRSGAKWIGTQWYREGVHEGWNWESANRALAHLGRSR